MMKRAIWLSIACACALGTAPALAQPALAQPGGEPAAGGGGSASGNTLDFEANMAASVRTPATERIELAPSSGGTSPSPQAATTTGPCHGAAPIPGIMEASAGAPVELSGILDAVNGTQITITTRTGSKLTLDAAPAMQSGEVTILVPGHPISIMGSAAPGGALRADVVQRSRGGPADWPPDCLPPG